MAKKSNKGFTFSLKSVAKKLYKTKKLLSNLSKTKWEDVNEQAQKLFEMANDRYNQLRDAGYYTFAMDTAKQTTGHDGFGYFAKKKPTKFQLLEEMYAARAFLNDYTSTLEGAEIESRKLSSSEYEGAFGKGWYAKYGTSYDQSRIDPEKAKIAFQIFREMEKEAAAFLYANNKSMYDSHNFIQDIYDIVNESYPGDMSERDASEFLTYGIEEARKLIHNQTVLADPTLNVEYVQSFIKANILIGRLRK